MASLAVLSCKVNEFRAQIFHLLVGHIRHQHDVLCASSKFTDVRLYLNRILLSFRYVLQLRKFFNLTNLVVMTVRDDDPPETSRLKVLNSLHINHDEMLFKIINFDRASVFKDTIIRRRSDKTKQNKSFQTSELLNFYV